MKHKLKCENILLVGVWLFLAIYMGVFVYLNMAKYAQHVDSDIASMALLSREMWTDKTLTPDNWLTSTERFIISTSAVASIIYGITGSMQTAMGCSCVLVGGGFSAVLYLFGRRLGLSRIASAAMLLALYALPINGLRNEGQMVPFIMLVLFLFAGYYAPHSILLMLTILFYVYLKGADVMGQKALGIFGRISWLFLFLAGMALSFGGERCLQMVILPLAIVEIITLYLDSKRFTTKLSRGRIRVTCFVGTMVLAFLVTTLYKGQVKYVAYLQNPQESMHRLFETVPAAILEGFGLSGNAILGSFASVMQILIWAFLALVGYGLVVIFRDKGKIPASQRTALVVLLTTVGVAIIAITMTSVEPAHNYFTVAWFAAVLETGMLVDYFLREKSALGVIILLSICIFALLNLGYTYKDAVTTRDNLKKHEEVADFLVEEGIEYGYAEFWDADRICLISDGAVTMGNVYRMDDPYMYWWLTSMKWYPPNLPEHMRTAYVVRIEKKSAFEEYFATDPAMELVFENEVFSVYFSDTNHITMR